MIEGVTAIAVDTPSRRVRFAPRDRLLGVASWTTLVIAVGLAVLGLADSSLRLDGYGLATGLPPNYYVALALLPAASGLQWFRGARANSRAIVLHVVLFVLIVWLTPLVLEGTPRFRASFTNYGYVDPVVRGVGLLPDRFIYHNWPLFPISMAALVQLTGVTPVQLMAVFPVVMITAYLIPLAVIMRMVGTHLAASAPDNEGTRSWRLQAAWPAGLWLFAV